MSLYKGDTPTSVDNKGWPWGPALWTTVLAFNYVYPKILNIFGILYSYKYRATYIFLKQTQLALEKYTLQILLSLVQAIKYDKLSLQVYDLCNLLFSYL